MQESIHIYNKYPSMHVYGINKNCQFLIYKNSNEFSFCVQLAYVYATTNQAISLRFFLETVGKCWCRIFTRCVLLLMLNCVKSTESINLTVTSAGNSANLHTFSA